MLFYVYPMMFRSNLKIWIGSVVVLIIPVTLSFIAATIFCLPLASRKAISIETGVQNTGLCLGLIAVSYDINLFVQISKFPILYSLINFSVFWVFVVLYRVVKLIRKHRGLDENKTRNPDDDEMKPTANEEKGEKSSLGKSDAGDLELHVTLL